jgi:hypothetical protein
MLIDVIKERGIEAPGYYITEKGSFSQWAQFETEMRQVIDQSQIFQVQNVTDYILATCPQDIWSIGKDFPYLRPPFEFCWMETGRPPYLNVNGSRSRYPESPLRWGIILSCQRVVQDGTQLALTAHMIYLAEKDRAVYTGSGLWQKLDSQGAPTGEMHLMVYGLPQLRNWYSKQGVVDVDAAVNLLGSDTQARCYPFLLALSLLHCKNVTTTIQDSSAKVRASRHRKDKPPLTKYYTLNIEPMKRILRTEGRSEEVGLKRALHICRGHFATYSEDKPLFGKVSGRFWIPAHVRGSKDAGEIKKDYRIIAPEAK